MIFSVKETEGHISLIIKDSVDGPETNLADTGYGYSQMLPIVTLLWMIHKDGRIKNNERTVVIEQLELHLHPAYQAKMMEVFVNIVNEARKKNIDLKIIFETHSETMINKLGELIADKQIDNKDVNVIVFNKTNHTTEVEQKEYDEDGLLKGWPVDFFSPEV